MHFKKYKSILSPTNNMNIYRGCTHGCIYCDSRSNCYQMDHEFTDIEVKTDLVTMLSLELTKKKKPVMIGTGSMSDPYMHIEKELQITRDVLEVIAKTNHGITILTKSDLVLRDLDLALIINSKSRFILQMTLTTADEILCQKIEPDVCGTKERLAVLKKFHDNGIETIVWMTPILPYINDTIDNIDRIVECCHQAGVKGIISFGMGLTLRSGNREYFYQKLDELFPNLKQTYQKVYGNRYECNSPRNRELSAYFTKKCQEYNIMCNVKEIFSYIYHYTAKESVHQLSLFDD